MRKSDHAAVGRVRELFLRGLGSVHLLAFWSLWPQVHGLIGEDGLSPAGAYLDMAREQLGVRAFHLLPTLGWVGAGDLSLTLMCVAGMLCGVILLVGRWPLPALVAANVLYLSLTVLGQEFLAFQWDALLVETTWLAILWAPLGGRVGAEAPEPHPAATWLLRWLAFRFMFASGVVKLVSGDAAWRDLSALSVHYETQPLPTSIGWWAHQLPAWAHVGACGAMFAIELVGPFLALLTRRLRALAFLAFAALQVVIALTGNYGFFNLLSVVVFLPLLDDRSLPRWLRPPMDADVHRSGRPWPAAIVWPAIAVLALLSVVPMARLAAGRVPLPGLLLRAYDATQPLRLVNGYGLFAVMTTERPEIVIEGSLDGVEWRTYRFRYKPGEVERRPGFVAPHMPRLDWQMWFAALRRPPPWYQRLLVHLLHGNPRIIALLAEDPFPEGAPRHVRSTLYRYRFTDRETRAATGAWWQRRELGDYFPVLNRRDAPVETGE